MHLIPVLLLTVLGAAVLFYLGSVLEKKAISGPSRWGLFLAGLILAAPGLLFVFYYTHSLTTLPGSTVSEFCPLLSFNRVVSDFLPES